MTTTMNNLYNTYRDLRRKFDTFNTVTNPINYTENTWLTSTSG